MDSGAPLEAKGVVVVLIHYGGIGRTVNAATLWSEWAEVVVVANDDTPRPDVPPNVVWLNPGANLGYGGGFNYASSLIEANVYVLMNTDLTVQREVFDGLCRLVVESTDIGVLAPTILFDDGCFQSAVGFTEGRARHPRMRPVQGERVEDAEWVTGAMMLMPKDFVRDFPFDEAYFLGCEDVDLCIRARNSGWRVVCSGELTVAHQRSAVIGRMWSYYGPRNEMWLARRHFGIWAGLAAYGYFLRRLPRTFAGDVIRRSGFDATRLHVLALKHAIRSLPDRILEGEPIPKVGQ